MRYYVRVAPYILPVVDGRPLIMKRYPNGIDGEPFYQHKAPEKVPPGVRAAKVPGDSVASRPIGGNLMTLLYMTQLAVHLAGSVVLARGNAAHGRSVRHRSRSDARREVRGGRSTSPAGSATSSRH